MSAAADGCERRRKQRDKEEPDAIEEKKRKRVKSSIVIFWPSSSLKSLKAKKEIRNKELIGAGFEITRNGMNGRARLCLWTAQNRKKMSGLPARWFNISRYVSVYVLNSILAGMDAGRKQFETQFWPSTARPVINRLKGKIKLMNNLTEMAGRWTVDMYIVSGASIHCPHECFSDVEQNKNGRDTRQIKEVDKCL